MGSIKQFHKIIKLNLEVLESKVVFMILPFQYNHYQGLTDITKI